MMLHHRSGKPAYLATCLLAYLPTSVLVSLYTCLLRYLPSAIHLSTQLAPEEQGHAARPVIAIVEAAEGEAMALEEAAWQRLHLELGNSLKGQYVAIFKGQLVDLDPSFDALFRRISARFPGQFVWLEKVRQVPEPILHFRSPRLEKQVLVDREERYITM